MTFFETPGRLAREGLSLLVVGRVAEIFGCSFDVQRRPVSLWLFRATCDQRRKFLDPSTEFGCCVLSMTILAR